jgi:hypothetical protein
LHRKWGGEPPEPVQDLVLHLTVTTPQARILRPETRNQILILWTDLCQRISHILLKFA